LGISFYFCRSESNISNLILIKAVPPTPTASNGGNGNGNGNGINGNGTTQIVNTGKSSADGLSSLSKIAIGVIVPVALVALAGFLW
jgi:hypothetical protein